MIEIILKSLHINDSLKSYYTLPVKLALILPLQSVACLSNVQILKSATLKQLEESCNILRE